jgi:hypothetical protein
MPQSGHTLTPEAARKLARIVHQAERQPPNKRPLRRRHMAAGRSAGPRRIRFELKGNLSSTTASATVRVVEVWSGPSPADGSGDATVWNLLGWTGALGSHGYADYNPASQRWEIVMLQC